MAISVPNLLRSRMAANEASAVGSLRTLNTAAAVYLSSYGHYPSSLRSFGPPKNGKPSEEAADLIDSALAGGAKIGILVYVSLVSRFRFPPGGDVCDSSSTREPCRFWLSPFFHRPNRRDSNPKPRRKSP
jgi:hypothetical protein